MEGWYQMDRIRINTQRSLVTEPPTSINFSELKSQIDGVECGFTPSDGGVESEKMENDAAYEVLIYDMLSNLEDQDRVIFLIQLLRDCGYRIDHGSFAKAIHMSRTKYMGLLAELKVKISLYIIGNRLGLLTKQK